MIKAVIFDLDDTLISEKQYIRGGYNYIANLLNRRYQLKGTNIFNSLMNR